MRFEVEGLDVWYGAAQAVFGLSLKLEDRETVALLGRNGAGKTTTLRACAGVLCRSSGRVVVDGTDIGQMSARRRSRRGVAWVPDDRRIFAGLKVADNLTLAGSGSRKEIAADLERTVDAFPMLGDLLQRYGRELSGGQQQVVAIARGLMSKPRVLLLDEPTEGLAPIIVEMLAEHISRLPDEFDVSVIMAESNLSFALESSSRAVFLENGRVAAEEDSGRVRTQTDLQARYLGLG